LTPPNLKGKIHEDAEPATIISCGPSPIENEKQVPEVEPLGYCDALPHPDKIFANKPTKQGIK
jgi:hypothetical protein